MLNRQVEGTFAPDYSGRGMYGATCLSYRPHEEEGSSVGEAQFEMAVVFGTLDLDDDDVYEVIERIRWELGDIGAPQQDSLGLGSVYYWPRIQVEGDGYIVKPRYR